MGKCMLLDNRKIYNIKNAKRAKKGLAFDISGATYNFISISYRKYGFWNWKKYIKTTDLLALNEIWDNVKNEILLNTYHYDRQKIF